MTSLTKYATLDFEIDQHILLAALKGASAIADRRAAKQVFSCVLLTVDKDGVHTCATDMTLSTRETLAALKLGAKGSLALPAQHMLHVVSTLPSKPLRVKGLENKWVSISVGRSEFKIMGQDPSDFPELPDGAAVKWAPLAGPVLRDLMERVAFSVSTDEARVNLNGALLESTGKRCTMVSTDGHRLTKFSTDLALPKLEKGVVIPRKGMMEMRRFLDRHGAGSMEFAVEAQHLFLRTAAAMLSVKLNNVVFPPYEQVIPRDHKRLAKADRVDLIDALRRAEVMAPEKTATVRVQLASGSLQLTADNPELGVAQQEIEVDFTGEPLVAGFNARYFLDVLEAMDTKQVALHFQGELDPCVIRPVDGPDYLGVVMPMRI